MKHIRLPKEGFIENVHGDNNLNLTLDPALAEFIATELASHLRNKDAILIEISSSLKKLVSILGDTK